MEHKYRMMKRLVFIFLLLLQLSSCGYFENDGIKSKRTIVGNIKICKYFDSDRNALVLEQSEQAYAILQGNCREVYYDSIKNLIYFERPVTDSVSIYYRVVVKDPLSIDVSQAYEKGEITKDTFKKGIKRNGTVQVEF